MSGITRALWTGKETQGSSRKPLRRFLNLIRRGLTRFRKNNTNSLSTRHFEPIVDNINPILTTAPANNVDVGLVNAPGEEQVNSIALHNDPSTTDPRIVQKVAIAIDYGTTFSGAAYGSAMYQLVGGVYTPEDKDSYIQSPKPVHQWRDKGYDKHKIPSTLAYKAGTVPMYGYEVASSIKNEPIGWNLVEWAKLLLETEEDNRHSIETPLTQARKMIADRTNTCPNTDLEVVADYLRPFWEHVKKVVETKIINRAEISTLQTLILTVPAKWSWNAVQRTYEAAILAGLGSNDSGYDFCTMTEPAAAAIYSLHSMKGSSPLKAGECFMICDAGGGTVDMVCYLVKTTQPLVLEEIVDQKTRAGASGNAYGSSHPDVMFKQHLEFDIGKEKYRGIGTKNMIKIMSRWEKLKISFDNRKEDYSVNLTPVFEGQYTEEKSHIKDGRYIISKADMEQLFDNAINKIDVEIAQQLGIVNSQQPSQIENLKTLILVGGFGRNKYVQSKLQSRYERSPELRIYNPPSDEAQMSVSYGAIHSVLNDGTEVTHISPYNIGYCCVTNSVKWLITRGKNFKPHEVFHEEMPFILRYDQFADKANFMAETPDIELETSIVLNQLKEHDLTDVWLTVSSNVSEYRSTEEIGVLKLPIKTSSLASGISNAHNAHIDLEILLDVEIHLTYGQITFEYGLKGEPKSNQLVVMAKPRIGAPSNER